MSDLHTPPAGFEWMPCLEDPRLVRLIPPRGHHSSSDEVAYYVEGRDKLYLIRDLFGRLADVSIPGTQPVDIADDITQRVRQEAKDHHRAYMDANRDSRDIYRQQEFWEDVLRLINDDMVTPRRLFMHSNLRLKTQITFYGGCQMLYDPIKDVILEYVRLERYGPKPCAFELLYGENLCNQMLAKEQLRKGTAPAPLAELARIAAFLRGKPTVRLLYGDGEETPTPRRKRVEGLGDVFTLSGWKLAVNDKLFGYSAELPVALAYGHNRLDLDLEALNEIPVLLDHDQHMESMRRITEHFQL